MVHSNIFLNMQELNEMRQESLWALSLTPVF